uniref:3CxxC-type domain-containing protein n=1 Tax=Mola mola TaxID=94237 RepID=A0A3Q3WH42_MOLML
MATYSDEPVDSFFYSPYNTHAGRPPRWKYKSYLSRYGDPSEDFSNQQRAHLKSILSQINPKLTPRLRKANTKDVAVQVNPRRDASVQCSIGPRTLLATKRDSRRRRPQEPAEAAGGVRYPRTLAVYSPIAFRSVTSFLLDERSKTEEAGEEPPEPLEPAGKNTEAATPLNEALNVRPLTRSPEIRTRLAVSWFPDPEPRLLPQFLEQKYGFYHCRRCNLRWESAYVWCVQGTSKVYFKQFCRKCQQAFNPYRVEDITCHTCNRARCSCALTQRHVDPKRPHRQDLCGRCKGKRLSCESTFSFKYIV